MTEENPPRGARAVYALTPFTMLDYPDHLSCIVWLAGCNFRCGYCHNPDMVLEGKNTKPWAEVEEFLNSRRGKLNAVVFSGGEATNHPHLTDFIREVKSMGFLVKLDTNGTRPHIVKALVEENLLDMVAMDYKAPKGKFNKVTNVADKLFPRFLESLDFLVANPQVKLEIRTTVHTNLLEEEDVEAIRQDLAERGYTGTYYVQNYRDTKTIGEIGPQFRKLKTEAFKHPAKVRIEFRNF